MPCCDKPPVLLQVRRRQRRYVHSPERFKRIREAVHSDLFAFGSDRELTGFEWMRDEQALILRRPRQRMIQIAGEEEPCSPCDLAEIGVRSRLGIVGDGRLRPGSIGAVSSGYANSRSDDHQLSKREASGMPESRIASISARTPQ